MGADHRRVLLVSDDPNIGEKLATAMRERSLEIEQASSAAEAAGRVRARAYSVVILDSEVRDRDRRAVLEALPSRAGMPVVLMLGATGLPLDREKASRVHGIFRKPIDHEEVAEVVAACAEVRDRARLEAMTVATLVSGAPIIGLL